MIGLSFDIEDRHRNRMHLFAGESVPPSETFFVQCEYLLDLLEERGIKATFFFLGAIAKHCIDLVKKVHQSGHEVAIHGYEHKNLAELNSKIFLSDTAQAMDVIQNAISAPVLGYRAPFFSLTSKTFWLIEALKELGFVYDSSLLPVIGRRILGKNRSNVFQFPNGIYEIPETVGTLGGIHIFPIGGGYFRLFPYVYSQWVIRQHSRRYGHSVIYHHNYDFFHSKPIEDAQSSRLILKRLKLWLRLVVSARSCGPKVRAKFDRLMMDFTFCPLSELIPCTDNKETNFTHCGSQSSGD